MYFRLARIFRRLTGAFRRAKLDRDLAEEIETHRLLIERDLEDPRNGEHETAAHRMGNITLAKEESRNTWTFQAFENLYRDLRYAFRTLFKSRGFTAVAVTTLALGMGANTAMFSVVDRVLFRPLPYRDSDKLVDLWRYNPKTGVPADQISYPDFLDLEKQNRVFDGMAGYREDHDVVLTGQGDPERLHALIASANLFDLLGVKPVLGSAFRLGQDRSGKEAVVVLSHRMWNRKFHSDPNILGHTIALDSHAYRIIGVMPAGFQFPISAEPVQLWVPISFDGGMTNERGGSIYNALARLKPGVTAAQASANMDVRYAGLIKEFPRVHTPEWHLRLVPELSDLVHDSRNALLILFAAVGVVLAIACANVANLLLARGAGRMGEIAVRAALGASRNRVMRQLLIESLLLAILGGVLGLAIGYWAIRILAASAPRDIPRIGSVSLDGTVFGFALLISLLTSALFGLLPALRISKVDLTESLRGRSEGLGSNKNRSRMRSALIVSEIALSLVTVIGAGLLLETLWHLEQANPGFEADHVLTFSIELPEGYSDSRRTQSYRDLLLGVRALPGVNLASAVFPLPFVSGIGITTMFDIEGRPFNPARPTRADIASVDAAYFRTMHIPLLAGRSFESIGDTERAIAVINKEFARRYFPDRNPIGERIRPDAQTNGTPAQMAEIVGIADDVKLNNLREDPTPIVFVPIKQFPIDSMTMVIRTYGDARTLSGAVRAQVKAIDPNVLLFNGRTLAQYVGFTLEQPRFNALLLTIFAALALVLTMVGVYGAASYAVSQRVHEIGIRTALGATHSLVLKLILRDGLRLILIGEAIGIATALAMMRLMNSVLFGVTASDPVITSIVAVLLAAVSLAACYFPARRALRVDPIISLRCQ